MMGRVKKENMLNVLKNAQMLKMCEKGCLKKALMLKMCERKNMCFSWENPSLCRGLLL